VPTWGNCYVRLLLRNAERRHAFGLADFETPKANCDASATLAAFVSFTHCDCRARRAVDGTNNKRQRKQASTGVIRDHNVELCSTLT
jgi:hypothetical protein